MVRILSFIIVAAIALALVYFLGKSASKKKFMMLLGSGILAAAVGVFMQTTFPLYQTLLGMLAVALIAAMIYMKVLEKEQMKNEQLLEERRNNKSRVQPSSTVITTKRFEEPASDKTYGMKSIPVVREEQKVE